jgi:hypothetical protein
MARAAYPEMPPDYSEHRAGSSNNTFPYLALHREEFTWPPLLPDAPVSSYLTISPITSCEAGIFSVALVVVRFHALPDVIRLAALWCSDFPLLLITKAITQRASFQGYRIIAKNVEQTNLMLQAT